MINPNLINHAVSNPEKNQGISRILSAAVINNRFRSLLLSDPVSAVSKGYGGECFFLKEEEKKRLSVFHACDLADFAAQLSTI